MALIGDTVGKLTGGLNFSGVQNTFTIFILIVVGAAVIGVCVYFLFMNMRYNKDIVIFESINGFPRITRRDKGMIVKIGDSGEEILYLKKHKVYRSSYGERIGAKQYGFQIGKDGYWYNVTFEDVEKGLNKIGLKPINPDLRYANSSVRKLLRDQHNKKSLLEKYGGLIAYGALIAVTGIMMWLLFDKYLEIANASSGAIQAAKEVLDATKQVLIANDNIKG